MKSPFASALIGVAAFAFAAEAAHAADAEQMKAECRARAAKLMGVAADTVEVKYEGQRTDKTHAVNGSALVRGQNETFQCSFERDGRRIVRFVVNAPAPAARRGSEGVDASASAASRRAGEGSFDATGRIPCAQRKGQPMGQCEFGVARAGGGTATVKVTHPDGRTRAIFFSGGKAVSADTSQADGYGEFRASRESDLFLIRVGEERYEIPEAVISGG